MTDRLEQKLRGAGPGDVVEIQSPSGHIATLVVKKVHPDEFVEWDPQDSRQQETGLSSSTWSAIQGGEMRLPDE